MSNSFLTISVKQFEILLKKYFLQTFHFLKKKMANNEITLKNGLIPEIIKEKYPWFFKVTFESVILKQKKQDKMDSFGIMGYCVDKIEIKK